MISSVRGAVLGVRGNTVVVEVGGVGLAVAVTPQQALSVRIGTEVALRTVLIVREDDLALYGFATEHELRVFDLLRGVTGVGPKSALGVLAVLSPDQVAQAVLDEDDTAFRKVSGIGPKTAKLIVLSLAGTLLLSAPATARIPASGANNAADVVLALVGLGWPERVARQTVDEVAELHPSDTAVPVLLRASLARLGPRSSTGTGSA